MIKAKRLAKYANAHGKASNVEMVLFLEGAKKEVSRLLEGYGESGTVWAQQRVNLPFAVDHRFVRTARRSGCMFVSVQYSNGDSGSVLVVDLEEKLENAGAQAQFISFVVQASQTDSEGVSMGHDLVQSPGNGFQETCEAISRHYGVDGSRRHAQGSRKSKSKRKHGNSFVQDEASCAEDSEESEESDDEPPVSARRMGLVAPYFYSQCVSSQARRAKSYPTDSGRGRGQSKARGAAEKGSKRRHGRSRDARDSAQAGESGSDAEVPHQISVAAGSSGSRGAAQHGAVVDMVSRTPATRASGAKTRSRRKGSGKPKDDRNYE